MNEVEVRHLGRPALRVRNWVDEESGVSGDIILGDDADDTGYPASGITRFHKTAKTVFTPDMNAGINEGAVLQRGRLSPALSGTDGLEDATVFLRFLPQETDSEKGLHQDLRALQDAMLRREKGGVLILGLYDTHPNPFMEGMLGKTQWLGSETVLQAARAVLGLESRRINFTYGNENHKGSVVIFDYRPLKSYFLNILSS